MVAPELRAATVYVLQPDVGTNVDAIMKILSQRQEYVRLRDRSDATATNDGGSESNEQTMAPVRDLYHLGR